MTHRRTAALSSLLLLLASPAFAIEGANTERTPDGAVVVRWSGGDPVDVYVSTLPDASIGKAKRLAKGDRAGLFTDKRPGERRPYFILRDETDGSVARVAERLIVLQRSSNFRDLGGYPAADGKHVRWGLIYRTAAMPMLTDADYAYVRALGIRSIVDLRSTEERQLAQDLTPVNTGADYFAKDYPASAVFSNLGPRPGGGGGITGLYREWLISLAPQYRAIFQNLLSGKGATSYHCSAGQDRAGVGTALILSALGVPRDVILQDYHLSTADRRPDNEMPRIAPGQYPGNPVAEFYRRAQAGGAPLTAKPLKDPAGVAYLQATFDEIDKRWGSVDAYLDQVLGVDRAAVMRVRALYLE